MSDDRHPLRKRAQAIVEALGDNLPHLRPEDLVEILVEFSRGSTTPLLNAVAKELRPCRACQEPLAFVENRAGKLVPYTMLGINHFLDCSKADEFRKRKRPGQ